MSRRPTQKRRAGEIWQLEEALKSKDWSKVLLLLTECTFSPDLHTKAVLRFIHQAPFKQSDQISGEWKYLDIVQFCSKRIWKTLQTKVDKARPGSPSLRSLHRKRQSHAKPTEVTSGRSIMLQKALRNKQWSRVLSLLEQYDFSPSECNRAVNMFIHQAPRKNPCQVLFLIVNQFVNSLPCIGLNCLIQQQIQLVSCAVRCNTKIFGVTPYCTTDQLDLLLDKAVQANAWQGIDKLIHNEEKSLARVMMRVGFAASADNFCKFILPECKAEHLVNLINIFVELGKWDFVQCCLHDIVSKALQQWLFSVNSLDHKNDLMFWEVIHKCRIGMEEAVALSKALEKVTAENIGNISQVGWSPKLCELLYKSLLYIIALALCSDCEENDFHVNLKRNAYWVNGLYIQINACIRDAECMSGDREQNPAKHWTASLSTLAKTQPTQPYDVLCFLEGLKFYTMQRSGEICDDILLTMFSTVPLFPILQSLSLRIMLREKRWDIISQACLSQVWEQVRRELFKAAVQQKQWKVVKQWADHTLCDDQRVWALQEAFSEKQWEVCMLLADHGLTVIELMRWHYRLAKCENWKVVRQMFERGADVEEVRLLSGNKMRDTRKKPVDSVQIARHRHLSTLNVKLRKCSHKRAHSALKQRTWRVALFKIMHTPCTKVYIRLSLQAAIESQAWHVVVQLVRLCLNKNQKDALFPEMIALRQWSVCKVLIEHGVNTQLCLTYLQEFIKVRQWTLVARVMERDVGDDRRRQMMECGLQRSEGSLVWQCITTLQHPLSVEERKKLFQQAFSRDIWQAVKPLVEVTDPTGIRHRDKALLKAIDHHQWDVVDHCQWHDADINMKVRFDEIPIQRAARKEDWIAVKELVVRDGDQSLLDSSGYSVLLRAIRSEQWDLVMLLIEYQGDIHLQSETLAGTCTPLQMLIEARKGEIINHTLLWCPGQCNGVTSEGETTLHALCLDEVAEIMYYQVARGVDPLAVTKKGQSALLYAVGNQHCPQKRVAECCRLGFSTHQPSLTRQHGGLVTAVIHNILDEPGVVPEYITSPFLLAILRGLPLVACMLYESGACSYRELFELLIEVMDPYTLTGNLLCEAGAFSGDRIAQLVKNVHTFLPQLTEMATVPRKLVTTCRLVISHSLTVRGRRHRDVQQLPVTERMKNYMLFSDLNCPDYGKNISWSGKC